MRALMKHLIWVVVLAKAASVGGVESQVLSTNSTCLFMSASCLAKGNGNFHLYQIFSRQNVKISKGDSLEYGEYLDPKNPEQRIAVDIQFSTGNLRDSKVKDQDGVGVHADDGVPLAVGRWHTRTISLDPFDGRNTTTWSVAFEGDKNGRYIVFINDVWIRHSDGTRTAIYAGGPPAVSSAMDNSNYSQHVAVQPVPLASVPDGGYLEQVIKEALMRCECLDRLDVMEASLDLIDNLLKTEKPVQSELIARVQKVRQVIGTARQKDKWTVADVDTVLSFAAEELKPVQPVVKQWTGHLVGHAHIDMQWLWEYPETVAEFGKTFGSAVKFMEEFSDFTFSQSSSAFYQETEASHPALFEKIKKYVREGRWEIVGGRICEGDTNIMSAESHARQFLYGQRFFRERFGKQAVVGWEPDTFGHTWQMPQILKHGGCKYYYFCRAGNGRGKGFPMYWWSAPDGSRVLAFEEPVISGWYNDESINKHLFNELADMTKRTGSKDELWVYGVGNHGGGPTRESINTANEWKKQDYLPTVKFSTAQSFFEVQKQDVLNKLPVVNDELNSVFEGCYTTHGDIKRWNDDSQAVMVSAETAAAIASRFGFEYPGQQIRRNWEGICWNHHHDTLDGSAVHAPYAKSKQMLEKVIASGLDIGRSAVQRLAEKTGSRKGDLMIFNPLAFDRDALVECRLPDGFNANYVKCGSEVCAVQVIDGKTRDAVIAVHKLPSVGYQVYRATSPWLRHAPTAPTVSDDGTVLENDKLKVTLDGVTGNIKSLYHKTAKRELVASGKSANRMELYYERPNGMPAWDIGGIDRVEAQENPVALKVVEKGPVRCTVEFTRKILASTVTQRVSLIAGGDSVICALNIDWREIGSAHPQWPFLKMAFDFVVTNGVATYETPFGAIVRPSDGHENPALKWFDLSAGDHGVSIMNDCKHGCSVLGGAMYLSLVRTPTHPDNTSDNYMQKVNYEIYPHEGDWKTAGTINHAFALTHPLYAVWLKKKGDGQLPSKCSFLKHENPNVVITAIKRAEDDDDLIVRMYESCGTNTTALLQTYWSLMSGKEVNFMEDDDVGKTAAIVHKYNIRVNLGKAEIQTLKLAVKPDPSVRMKGTRGPGPARSF